MSRRRLVTVFVCIVFLSLIGMTAHSLFSEIENAEAESVSESEYRESRRVAMYTSGSSRGRSHRRPEVIATDSPDAGAPDLFTRELMRCARSDCWSRRGSRDAGVMSIALPPPPPKVR